MHVVSHPAQFVGIWIDTYLAPSLLLDFSGSFLLRRVINSGLAMLQAPQSAGVADCARLIHVL